MVAVNAVALVRSRGRVTSMGAVGTWEAAGRACVASAHGERFVNNGRIHVSGAIGLRSGLRRRRTSPSRGSGERIPRVRQGFPGAIRRSPGCYAFGPEGRLLNRQSRRLLRILPRSIKFGWDEDELQPVYVDGRGRGIQRRVFGWCRRRRCLLRGLVPAHGSAPIRNCQDRVAARIQGFGPEACYALFRTLAEFLGTAGAEFLPGPPLTRNQVETHAA